MINAVSISTRVEKIIKENMGGNIEGHIHSVFDYACNIQMLDQGLISLISKKYGDNPYSISINLPTGQTMKKNGIQQGMKVIINSHSICSVVGSFYINLENATSWDSSFSRRCESLVSKIQLQDNFRLILRVLLKRGNFLGIGTLIMDYPHITKKFNLLNLQANIKKNDYSLFVSPMIKDFICAIIKGDYVLTKKIIVGIVGFGPGLTPSADDLLVGLMASLYYLVQYYKRGIDLIFNLKKILLEDTLANQTTFVSWQMLKAAAQGEFAKPIKELCIAMTIANNEKKLKDAVLEVINLGSTSGTDTILGLVLGKYIIEEIYLQKEKSSDICLEKSIMNSEKE